MINRKNKERIDELKRLIIKYDTLYYEQGISEISDAEYDRLYDEYLKFEKEYPEIKNDADAPTKRVGAGDRMGTTTGLPKFTHKSPLLSIDRKAKEISELKDFYEKCGGDGLEVIVQPKLDGITCNINYEDGNFVNAATRGNGYIGDLITNNFKMTDTKYPYKIYKGKNLEVRGEAIIPYDFFKRNLMEDYSNPRNAVAGIMRQIEPKDIKGKGVQVLFYDIGQTDINIKDGDYENVTLLNEMNFQIIPQVKVSTWKDLEAVVESNFNGMIQQIDGFNVLVHDKTPQAVCDGLVIKVNSKKLRTEIGFSEKGPKWAFAYKFKPLQAITRINHVEWQTSKSGRINPVAVFNEISLGGTKITKATLNNYDYMKKMPVLNEEWLKLNKVSLDSKTKEYEDRPLPRIAKFDDIRPGVILEDLHPEKSSSEYTNIKVLSVLTDDDINECGFYIDDEIHGGDWYPFEEGRYKIPEQYGLQVDDLIIVERSNDVIPRVVAIHKHQNYVYQGDLEVTLRFAKRKSTFEVPKTCPDCGSALIDSYPLYYCSNQLCPSRMKGLIIHYASRDAMNIVGLGEGIVDTLFKEGFLTDIPSVYELIKYKEDIEKLPKFGKKKVEKLLNSIENTKQPELWQFIYALSIDGIGKKSAKDLAQRYHTLENFLDAKAEELLEMEDIGEIVCQNVISFLQHEETKEMMDTLQQLGVHPKEVTLSGDSLKGQIFVITGTLENSRKYYQDIIESNGGKVSGSVSKKTTAVLIGSDAGSKEDKARKLVAEGNPIILLDTEEKVKEFFNI